MQIQADSGARLPPEQAGSGRDVADQGRPVTAGLVGTPSRNPELLVFLMSLAHLCELAVRTAKRPAGAGRWQIGGSRIQAAVADSTIFFNSPDS